MSSPPSIPETWPRPLESRNPLKGYERSRREGGSAVSWRQEGGSTQPIRAPRRAGFQPIAAHGSAPGWSWVSPRPDREAPGGKQGLYLSLDGRKAADVPGLNLAAEGIMVGGLKRKHSDLEEEEEDEKWDWSAAGLRSYQQALLRISLDKVQRSLGPRAPSLRRHVLIHNTLQQLQASLCLAPAPALPPEPLFLGEEDFSLSTTIGSILRELETSTDETDTPQNPVATPGPQNEVLPQPDPVFLEALSSRYLGDSGLDDFFLDIDTSTVEKEPALAPPEPPHNLFCAPGSWEWNELDHIMEIILGS